jgi:hypothetical protein
MVGTASERQLPDAAPICTYATRVPGVQTPVGSFVPGAGLVAVRQTFVLGCQGTCVRVAAQNWKRLVLLIAASDRAHASGSLDGHRPAAPTPTVIAIIVIPAIMLTVAGTTHVNRNTAGTNVHALSEGRCRSRGKHCTSEAEREQR